MFKKAIKINSEKNSSSSTGVEEKVLPSLILNHHSPLEKRGFSLNSSYA